MNEKIEKLAEQCGIIGGDIYEDRVVDYEKFAELIIRECIEIVNPSDHHQAFPDSYIAGHEGVQLLDGTVAQIKEHFGVDYERKD